MAEATAHEDNSVTGTAVSSSSSKRKAKEPYSRGHEITTLTIKAPPFSYAHLELLSSASTSPDVDILTMRKNITSALTQFLGLSGSAISVDILKVEGGECWVRVPREDLSPFLAAVGGWVGEEGGVGWRVRGKGNWLASLVARSGEEEVWNG